MAKQHDDVYKEQGNWNTWLIFYPKKLRMKDGDCPSSGQLCFNQEGFN